MDSDKETPATAKRGKERPLYSVRERIYWGLFLFVIVAGLAMGGVAQLRERLLSRYYMLKTAAFGEIKPAVAQVGANMEPLPPEFQRPTPPKQLTLPVPERDKIYVMTPNRQTASQNASNKARLEVAPPPSGEGEGIEAQSTGSSEEKANDGLQYRQGKIEQTAYDLVLQSNKAVAEMVKGGNPSLQYKSWDATDRGSNIYWVRLKFLSKENTESDFIWQVNLEEKKVTPLNYNARTIQ